MSHSTGEAAVYQQALIDKLVSNRLIQSPLVEAAFRAVPRHLFLPDIAVEKAYEDTAIPTKMKNGRAISSSSQPAMMAIMLEQLDLQPGHRVLEIGAGTGFNAALMAHIVGERGQVTTLDIDEDLVLAARNHLQTAGVAGVEVIRADGALGWAANAPYDRIILTVGGWDISPAWLEQSTANGRLLLPLSINGPQLSVAFDRENGRLVSQSVSPCGFMRLRGPFAEPAYELSLGPVSKITLEAVAPLPDQADTFYQWLLQPRQQEATQISVTHRQLWSDLLSWLALHQARCCRLTARGQAAEAGIIPSLYNSKDAAQWQSSIGLWDDQSLAFLDRQQTDDPARMALVVCGFGPQATAEQQLLAEIQNWDSNGRPRIKNLLIIVYPLNHPYQPAANELVIRKQWHQFILRWRER